MGYVKTAVILARRHDRERLLSFVVRLINYYNVIRSLVVNDYLGSFLELRMNRKMLSGVMAILVVGVMSVSTFAAAAKRITVTGQLLDMKCYSAFGATGRAHGKTCGKKCLESGIPAGILIHGQAWTLATNSRPLAPYVGLTIEVMGKANAHDHVLIPSMIKVKDHGHWKIIVGRSKM